MKNSSDRFLGPRAPRPHDAMRARRPRSQGTILEVVLAVVFLLFIGILVAVYFVAKEAAPVLLDERGRPIVETPSQ